MGLPVPANAPTIIVSGRTYGVGVFVWNTPDGANNTLGVFELIPATGWDFVTSPSTIAIYLNPGDMVADVNAKGGSMKYLQWFVAQVNAAFAKLFGKPPGPVPDPVFTTDAEAMAWMQASVAGMKLTLVNGVPVLA